MEDRPFIDPKIKPADKSLRAALGKAFGSYSKIMERTASFPKEWAFSKSSGWMLKVHDKKKALLYLIPLAGSFRISLTLREKERVQFMADHRLAGMRSQLESSRKYAEGYALISEIRSERDFNPFDTFLQKLIAVRKGAT